MVVVLLKRQEAFNGDGGVARFRPFSGSTMIYIAERVNPVVHIGVPVLCELQ
jgi:hypothetical protein